MPSPFTYARDIVEKKEVERQHSCDAKLLKMQEGKSKHIEKVDANREVVSKLLKAAKEEGYFGEGGCPCLSDKSQLEYCTLKEFGLLTCPVLKAFIVAHDDKLVRLKDIPK